MKASYRVAPGTADDPPPAGVIFALIIGAPPRQTSSSSARLTATIVGGRRRGPFVAFTGIGQKNAAMAVEILERDLGVAVANLHRSDIVYDVHVRRVFLLTRLADRDERDHMIAVARQLYPA